MLALTRKNQIRKLVLEKKSVTVSDLSKRFSVTEETIRRDLKSLEEAGVLIRTYGGAFIQEGVMNDVQMTIREGAYVPNKQKIARKCAEFIQNGDTISLDASTTAFHICNEIKNTRLTILTDSLKSINYLSEFENINLISTGGTLERNYFSFIGRAASQTIREYYVDKVFVSCRSLDMEHGITEANEHIAAVRRLLIERANEVFLIADHSKFDKVSFVNICDFDKIDSIIVDQPLSSEWHEFLEARHINLYECDE